MRNDLSKPSVYGKGILGCGEYLPSVNKKRTRVYMVWQEMLRRCYDKKLHERCPTYKDCIVSPEWLNFQTFGKWYDDNYYEFSEDRMNLDKDILFKDNKIYSADTCIFVPHNINMLFVRNSPRRGIYPIGVSIDKRDNRFISECNAGKGVAIKLGRFSTPEEAFLVYKLFKENLIKQVANEYKLFIPKKLYMAMMNYKVEITD